MQRIELVGDRGRIEIVGESLAFERFEPPLSEHLPSATEMFEQPAIVSESVELPAGRGDHLDVHRISQRRSARERAARAGARRALVAGARERDRPLDAHRQGRAAAGRPRRVRGAACRPPLREGRDALTRIAFSNLAAPAWTLERAVEAVSEYGYDGLELRLLDGEPIDPLSLDAGTRRSVGSALDGVPLVALDTSIELARPFERELPAALELATEWGASTVRVFGGESQALDDIARRLEPRLARATAARSDGRARDPRWLLERGAGRRVVAPR